MAILQEKVGISNEDLRKIRSMRPGRSVDLQVTTASATKRVRTEFVGMDGTRCMIVRFPDEGKWGSLGTAIFKDKNIILRYILEDETGEIIAFKVKVIMILTKPGHLVFTSFPLAIQSHDLRAEPRAAISIAATIVDAELSQEVCQSLVLDISVNGCRISVDKKAIGEKPRVNQKIEMHFSASNDRNIFLEGEVKNSKSDGVNLYYGVKFDTPEQEVKTLLDNLMVATD